MQESKNTESRSSFIELIRLAKSYGLELTEKEYRNLYHRYLRRTQADIYIPRDQLMEITIMEALYEVNV